MLVRSNGSCQSSIVGADPSRENIIALPPSLLDLPLPQANEHTAALTQAHCRDLLERRHARAGLSGRVRDLLLGNPAAPLSAEQAAHELNMSLRTLRHRLAAEGTSFRELLDEVRQRLAEEMLIVSGLTVAETAQRLGYLYCPASPKHSAVGMAWGPVTGPGISDSGPS